MTATSRVLGCHCAACRLTPPTAPECSHCGDPMREAVWNRQEGVCTKCIPSVPAAFRSARLRVIEQTRADRRQARLAREAERRQEGRRGHR